MIKLVKTSDEILRETVDTIESLKSEIMSLKEENKEIKKQLDNLSNNLEVIELREMPIAEVKPLIIDFVKQNPGCWTSDIVNGIEVEPEIVIQALNELKKEGKINPKK